MIPHGKVHETWGSTSDHLCTERLVSHACLRHDSGNLVSRHERKGHRHGHVVHDVVDVRVADAAVLDVDGDVIGTASIPLDCKLKGGEGESIF